MTIKDVAARTHLTHQAIYKRLKKNGITIEAIKDPKTGHFTPSGEQTIIDLFHLNDAAEKAIEPQEKTPADELHNRLQELTTDNEQLRNQLQELTRERDLLAKERDLLADERNNLRSMMEREQQLRALSLQRLPAGDTEKGRIRAAWDVLRGRR